MWNVNSSGLLYIVVAGAAPAADRCRLLRVIAMDKQYAPWRRNCESFLLLPAPTIPSGLYCYDVDDMGNHCGFTGYDRIRIG